MYCIAFDQSTFATKALLFDNQARRKGRYNITHRQIHPAPGWVEHDPEEIYHNLLNAAAGLLKETGVRPEEITYVSITNQRETTVVWNGNGEPVYNAVVWQCNRAEDIVQQWELHKKSQKIKEKTGLPLSPYFPAAKAAWILRSVPKEANLYFGTIDSWLIYRLTGKHVTDTSNASRTQLFNIHTLRWDEELISFFDLEPLRFPDALGADAVFGETDLGGLLPKPVPITGVMGDSHGALYGQGCRQKGLGKCTFGTGSSIMVNIGDRPSISKKGLSTSIAWTMHGRTDYVYEGNINCSADTINWLRDELGILPDAEASGEYAGKVLDNQGVYLVPAFVGLSSPYFSSKARAVICGMSRNANKYHIVRAGLEAIAYQIRDIVDIMRGAVGFEELRVDGGATKNEFLMQFVADILDMRIVKNKTEEASALGACLAGGKKYGLEQNEDALADTEYKCTMEKAKADQLYEEWKKAVERALL